MNGPAGKRATTIPGVMLRPSDAGTDQEFLYRIYAASRADEMAQVVDWSDAQKEDFLHFQFRAQHTHYHQHYPDADYDVIVRDDLDIGRLYVQSMEHEIRLMDIALLPPYRCGGIGTALMHDVLQQASRSQRFVSLHVEEHNPAKRLYARLGFTVVGELTFYKRMHWVPAGLTPICTDGFKPCTTAG